jgi:hypothetical protein
MSIQACRPGVTGRFLFRTLGLPAARACTHKHNMHLFYSSLSSSILVSDNEKHIVCYAVARCVNAVDELF